MELIKGLKRDVKISLPPEATGVVAQVKDANGTNIGNPINITLNNGLASFNVPFAAVAEEGERSVVVSFTMESQSYSRTLPISVVTPYLDLWEIHEVFNEASISDAEAWKLERAVRNVINAHCGQSFGYAHKAVSILGDRGIALSLPERLVSLDEELQDIYVITGDGWFLKKKPLVHDWEYETSSPIVAPLQSSPGEYMNDAEYLVSGYWGYESVPTEVVEAAKLLVEDYACADQSYRDKFVTSVSSADWRMQFHDGAFYDTGNSRANLLLSPYVANRMRVI